MLPSHGSLASSAEKNSVSRVPAGNVSVLYVHWIFSSERLIRDPVRKDSEM